ncbi:MAG: hypothetical protein IJY26_00045 [Clostridia bacterium]|nr:hypothetical protein [Clostridia bacterium]
MSEENKKLLTPKRKPKQLTLKKAEGQKQPQTKPNAKLTPKKLKLLITIVNKNKAEFYMDLLHSFEVNMQICMLAQGTATSQMRHVLGLEDSERAVLFSFIREDKAEKALKKLEEKFETIKNGKGIAYTVPLSSVVGVAIYQFLSNNRMTKDGK